jgi:hypothetical protein
MALSCSVTWRWSHESLSSSRAGQRQTHCLRDVNYTSLSVA